MAPPLTVVQLLPALESGGVERSTLEISTALVEAGHRAIVVSAGGRLLPFHRPPSTIGNTSSRSAIRVATLSDDVESADETVDDAEAQIPRITAINQIGAFSTG